jgi:DNA-directed RNA polymerase specialized sigma24 family protein
MFDGNETILRLNDDCLRPLIKASDDIERLQEIERLMLMRARPVIDGVLSRFARGSFGLQSADADDVASTVSLRLVRKLRAVPASAGEAIRKFDDYVAGVTYHAIHDLARNRHPERTRLENRLRHVVTHDRRLALWGTTAGMLCGLAAWADSAEAGSILGPLDSLRLDRERPAEALVELFERTGRPLPFVVVVNELATRWGVHDEEGDSLADIIDDQPGQLARLETRQLVGLLWEEIGALPERQRTALLLNLRDASGLNALALFPLTGVASFGDVAAAIGIRPEELTAIWKILPLDDLYIARRLGATRQQVINLRKSARERLRRRLARRNEGAR